MFYTLSHDALHLCEVLSKYLKRFQLTELSRVHGRNGHFQYFLCSKGSNSKRRSTTATVVLVFCTSLIVLYICETFHENISNSFQLKERTQVQCTL